MGNYFNFRRNKEDFMIGVSRNTNSNSLALIGSNVIINDIYNGSSPGLYDSKILMKLMDMSNNKQHHDLKKNECRFNIWSEFHAVDAKKVSFFYSFGFTDIFSAVLTILGWVYVTLTIIYAFKRFRANLILNYKDDEFFNRVTNRDNIRHNYRVITKKLIESRDG